MNKLFVIWHDSCSFLWQITGRHLKVRIWGLLTEPLKCVSVSSQDTLPMSFESHRVKVTLGEEDVSCCSFHHPCLAWSVSVFPRPIGSYNVDHVTWPRPITARACVARPARAEETDSPGPGIHQTLPSAEVTHGSRDRRWVNPSYIHLPGSG